MRGGPFPHRCTAYMCTYVHTRTYICMVRTPTHICACIYMHIFIYYICMVGPSFMYMRVLYMHMYAHVCICMHMYAHICTYMYDHWNIRRLQERLMADHEALCTHCEAMPHALHCEGMPASCTLVELLGCSPRGTQGSHRGRGLLWGAPSEGQGGHTWGAEYDVSWCPGAMWGGLLSTSCARKLVCQNARDG